MGAYVTLLCGCAGRPSVLEELKSEGQTAAGDSAQSPVFQELSATLARLGYQGVGLQYESEGSLQLLKTVFSDPRAAGRKVKLVYTGLHMSYDPKYQSLTIGGSADAGAILDYISKKVPAATVPAAGKKR